jgi:hypothetical protein
MLKNHYFSWAGSASLQVIKTYCVGSSKMGLWSTDWDYPFYKTRRFYHSQPLKDCRLSNIFNNRFSPEEQLCAFLKLKYAIFVWSYPDCTSKTMIQIHVNLTVTLCY